MQGYAGRMRILLVDDDISSVSALANLLKHEHSLKVASNGMDALSAFKVADFDTVITDIKMPKMNGIDLLKAIRETGRNTQIIVITGYPSKNNITDAEKYRVRAFFTKPINVERFMDTLLRIEQELDPH
jgi:YesN/AraC family two-component response regulator